MNDVKPEDILSKLTDAEDRIKLLKHMLSKGSHDETDFDAIHAEALTLSETCREIEFKCQWLGDD